MNRCRPEKKDTKEQEHGNMLNIILKIEKREVPDRKAKTWKVEGEKGRVTRKARKRLAGNLESEVS